MAYLDGKTPYILACRGTYKLMVVDAWQLNSNKLERAWRWDSDEENPVVRSMGSHNMICGDVDQDGKDEILLGSCMLDNNGTLLWSTGLGHPDKIYLTDIDPNRPGMEVFLCLEPWHDNGRGVCVVDAKTGHPFGTSITKRSMWVTAWLPTSILLIKGWNVSQAKTVKEEVRTNICFLQMDNI